MPLFAIMILGTALTLASWQVILADDDSTTNLAAPASGSDTGTAGTAQGERGGRWKEAFAQLNLTDAQKAQIKQIRADTQPGKERRQQIMAVLTPDQQAKLKQLIQSYRSQKQGNDGTADTPGNP